MKKSMLLVISLLACCSVFAQGVKFDALSLDQALGTGASGGESLFLLMLPPLGVGHVN